MSSPFFILCIRRWPFSCYYYLIDVCILMGYDIIHNHLPLPAPNAFRMVPCAANPKIHRAQGGLNILYLGKTRTFPEEPNPNVFSFYCDIALSLTFIGPLMLSVRSTLHHTLASASTMETEVVGGVRSIARNETLYVPLKSINSYFLALQE